MRHLLAQVCLIGAAAVQVYVDSSASVPQPDGTEYRPFKDLASALSIPAAEITVIIAPVGTRQYALSALGSHETAELSCNANSVSVTVSVLVLSGQSATFTQCLFTSTLTGRTIAVFVVYGKMVMNDCELRYVQAKSIVVFGELQAAGCHFHHNRDSVLSSNSVGWTMRLAGSTFSENVSVVGTVFAISSSGVAPGSSLLIAENCTFANNSAFVGGSVALFMESMELDLPEGFDHTETFRHCVFTGNSGYAFLVYEKNFQMRVEDSEFRDMGTCIVLISYGGQMYIQKVSIINSARLLFSTIMQGYIQLHGLQLSLIRNGPAIYILDRYYSNLGFVSLQRASFTACQLPIARNFAATLLLSGVSGEVSGVTVKESSTQVALGGFYANGSFRIWNLTVTESQAVAGGAAVFLFSSAQLWSVSVSHSSTKNATWVSAFSSNLTLTDISIWHVHTNYTRFGQVSYSMFSFINSYCDLSQLNVTLPRISSTPLIIQVTSDIYIHDVEIAELYSSLAITVVDAVLTVDNVVIHLVDLAKTVFDVSVRSTVSVTRSRFESGSVSHQFLLLESSTASLSSVVLDGLYFPSLVSSIKSNYSLSAVHLRRVTADVLFPIQIQW